MYAQNLLGALRDLIRSEIAAELDRRAAGDENKPQRAENTTKAQEKPVEQPTDKAERGDEQELGALAQAELAADREARAAREEARLTRDPIVPLDGRGPEPTDKDRASLTAALKALIVEQNDAAQEFRHLVREGKQCACSACRDWGEFEGVVDFINYRRELKNGCA